jgi:hypothetical protein
MGRGERWLQHEQLAHRKASHKNNIILQMRALGFTEIPKTKLLENLSKARATDIERILIQLLGRSPNGPLTNISGGGEGILDLTKECLAARAEKIAAALRTPETRAKLSAAGLGRKLGPMPEECKARISAKVRGFKHTEEAKAKISARSKLMRLTPERIEKLRQFNLGRKMPPELREKLRKINTGRVKTPEEIEKRRKKMIGRRHSPETIAKQRIAQSNRSVETRARISAAAKTGWIKRKRNSDQYELPSLNPHSLHPPHGTAGPAPSP